MYLYFSVHYIGVDPGAHTLCLFCDLTCDQDANLEIGQLTLRRIRNSMLGREMLRD